MKQQSLEDLPSLNSNLRQAQEELLERWEAPLGFSKYLSYVCWFDWLHEWITWFFNRAIQVGTGRSPKAWSASKSKSNGCDHNAKWDTLFFLQYNLADPRKMSFSPHFFPPSGRKAFGSWRRSERKLKFIDSTQMRRSAWAPRVATLQPWYRQPLKQDRRDERALKADFRQDWERGSRGLRIIKSCSVPFWGVKMAKISDKCIIQIEYVEIQSMIIVKGPDFGQKISCRACKNRRRHWSPSPPARPKKVWLCYGSGCSNWKLCGLIVDLEGRDLLGQTCWWTSPPRGPQEIFVLCLAGKTPRPQKAAQRF